LLGSLWFNSFSAGGSGGAGDYELISTTVLGSSAASVTFSGLGTSAAAYKHLQIRIVNRSVSSNANTHVRFNGDTGSNYSMHQLYGTGSGVGSAATTSGNRIYQIAALPPSSSQFAPAIVDILDFSSTTKNKTLRSLRGMADPGAGLSDIELLSGAWYSTAAVTSMEIFGDFNFVTGSRFSLYGLK